MKTNLGLLLDAVKANPDDDTVRLAYADELEEAGKSERAELIRWQIENGPAAVPKHITISVPFVWHDYFKTCWTREQWEDDQRSWTDGLYRVWFDRGFVKGIRCDWQWWVKNGDALTAEEWVPLVQLTDVPPLRSESTGTVNNDVFSPDDPKDVRFSAILCAGKNDGYWSKTMCELRWVGTTFELPVRNPRRMRVDDVIRDAIDEDHRRHFESVVANMNEEVLRHVAAIHGIAWEDAPRRMNRIEMSNPTDPIPRQMECGCEARRMVYDALWEGRAVRETGGLISRIELTPRFWYAGGTRYASYDGVCPACRTVYFSVTQMNNTVSEPGIPFAPPWSGEVTRDEQPKRTDG